MPRLVPVVLILTGLGAPVDAFAHGGHLGELAGHSHWIAVAAGAVAVSIAAAIILLGKEDEAEMETEGDEESTEATPS